MSAGSMSALDHAIGMFLNPGEAWRKTMTNDMECCRHGCNTMEPWIPWWLPAFRIPSWWKSNLSLNGRPLGATCAIVYSNARLLDCSAICLYFELSFDSGVSTHFLCDLQFHWISLTLDFQKSLTLRCSRTKTELTKVHIPSYGRCLHGCWTVLGSVRAFERALKSNVFSNKTNKMWVYPQLGMKITKSDG